MRWVFVVVLALGGWGLSWVRTDGFSPDVCQRGLAVEEQVVFQGVWPEKFVYLGRGKQAFAFVSEDGKHVLKLFDTKHLNQSWHSRFFSARKARVSQRQQIFPQSYRLAFDFFPGETGLFCVHMGRTHKEFPIVELVDKASRSFRVNLNEMAFVLQTRGHGTLLEKLTQVKHDSAKLRAVLDEYLALHAKRIALSIADYDRDIRRNYAWAGERLLYIDPARFYLEPKLSDPARRKHEWWGCTYRLRKWLTKEVPDEVGWFDEQVNARQF